MKADNTEDRVLAVLESLVNLTIEHDSSTADNDQDFRDKFDHKYQSILNIINEAVVAELGDLIYKLRKVTQFTNEDLINKRIAELKQLSSNTREGNDG